MKELPSATKVVVIGGGVAGCSTAYHLAKFGWKDTILLERDQLTSGTTWHAAGLVSQLGPSAAITKIRKYSLELYKELAITIKHAFRESDGLLLDGNIITLLLTNINEEQTAKMTERIQEIFLNLLSP